MFDWSEKGKNEKRSGEGGYNLPRIERKEGEIRCELKMSNKPFIQVIVNYYYFLFTTNYHFLYSTSINGNSLKKYHLFPFTFPLNQTKQSYIHFLSFYFSIPSTKHTSRKIQIFSFQ